MSGGDWKAMFHAIQKGDIDLVDYYLKVGIDPNYQHPEYMASPLVESIRFGHIEISKLLLAKGADPHAKEVMGGDTALEVAESKKNAEAIELIKAHLKA
jgi:ankyrin repeat protein